MADEQDNGAPRPNEAVPAAAPQAGGGAAMVADDLGEEPGLSGWLVMWGPLLIVGFLILVFMGQEREPALPTAVVEESTSESVTETSTTLVAQPLQPEPLVEQPSGDAASELAAAFKAAGIAPPQTENTAATPMPLPKDLQGSPWTPSKGAAAAPPPPPGYAQAYGYPPMPAPGYAPMPYGYPPAGYGQMAPGYGQMAPGYGQMMPGYGQMAPGYGRGQGYRHGQMMAPGYGHMPPGYAPYGQAAQPPAAQPPAAAGTPQQ